MKDRMINFPLQQRELLSAMLRIITESQIF